MFQDWCEDLPLCFADVAEAACQSVSAVSYGGSCLRVFVELVSCQLGEVLSQFRQEAGSLRWVPPPWAWFAPPRLVGASTCAPYLDSYVLVGLLLGVAYVFQLSVALCGVGPRRKCGEGFGESMDEGAMCVACVALVC